MNGEVVVVAGLIVLAVGQEIVIVHPRGHASATLSLLLFRGPLLYLLAQAWYLRVVSGRLPGSRLAAAGANPRGRNLTGDAALRRSGAYDQPPRGSGSHLPSRGGDLSRDSVTAP
jgi:hypothetical protein